MFLLTAFNPFANWTYNTSKRVLHRYMAGLDADMRARFRTEILNTEYQAADERVCRLITEFRPSGVLLLGMARKRNRISLERFALNIDDAETADNTGLVRRDTPIVENGPAAYQSKLPLVAVRDALTAGEIPVRVSNHAGGFLCNHVFYQAHHQVAQLGLNCPVGFVHLPPLLEETGTGLPAQVQVKALGLCVDALIQFVDQ